MPRAVLRAVADNNTVISGLLWRGPERALLDAARAGHLQLYTSAALLAELADVLPRAKFTKRVTAAGMSVDRLVRRYARFAQRVVPAEIGTTVLNDPDDDRVLACALAAQVDLIVSGDKHLRNLKTYQHIPILSATEALAKIQR